MTIVDLEWARNLEPIGNNCDYPVEMLEYANECESTLGVILNDLQEQYGTSINDDLRIEWNKTRFDLTSSPVDFMNEDIDRFERIMELRHYGHINPIEMNKRCECKINLVYTVELYWLRRPNHYTDYYSVKFMDKLAEKGIPFTCGDAKWLSDESNGQMFKQVFEIDFSKEISEDYVHKLQETLNGTRCIK